MKRSLFAVFLALIFVVPALAQEKTVPVQDKYGNQLLVQMNPKTGSAHRIYGHLPNISIYGFRAGNLNQMSIGGLSERFFVDYGSLLRIDPSQMKFDKAETDGKMWFVTYKQSVNDVPVYRSEIGYTIDQNGDVVALGADGYPNISVSTTPQVTKSSAQAVARKAFGFDSTATEEECALLIYPKEEKDTTVLYLAWKILLSRVYPLKEVIYFVDAQSGGIIDSMSNILEGDVLRGQVTGSYWPVHNDDATVQAGFKTTHIKVWNYLGQQVADVNSDADGNYSAGYLATTYYYVQFVLQNDYVQSRDAADGGNAITYGAWYMPGIVNRDWGATDGTSVRWLASAMHDYFKNSFGYSSMDYQMGAYINEGPYYNGGADGTNIVFGSQDGQLWARSSDVVYHEYTHNTIHHIYGAWIGDGYDNQGSAMDEGLADYFACTKNNDAVQGEDVGVSRNLQNTKKIPDDWDWYPSDPIHGNGVIIGGACWDLRQSSGVGQTVGDNLVFGALQVSPHAHNFSDFLGNIIVADNSYYSGSHVIPIKIAFAKHGIGGTHVSGTISSNTTWSGTYIVDGTVTVNSGVTLTISPGTVAAFESGTSLISNGVVNASGTSSQRITFTSTGSTSPGSWGSVQFNGSGSSGSMLDYVDISYGTQIDVLNTSNVSIKHCNITDNSGHGINVNYSSGFLAQYNSIMNTNYNHGILINGGSNNSCYDNVIKKTDDNRQGAGIQFGGTGGNVGRNDIRSYNWGIGAIWGASPYARTSYGLGINNRITNCQTGLMVYRESYPIFGTPPPSDFMWNSIYGNTYNARVGTSYPDYPSGLAAYGNWWGSAPPPSNYQVGPNSWFYFNPYLSSDPWYGRPLPSTQPAKVKGTVVASVSSVLPSGQATTLQADDQETITEDPLSEGIGLRDGGKFKAAKDFFVSYLGKHPDNQRAYVELYNCYNDGKDGSEETSTDIMEYFKSLPQSASKDHKLLLSYMYLSKGDVKLAREINEGIESENRNTSLATRAQLNNFYIALYCENDPQAAASILREVMNKRDLSTPMELSTAQTALATYVDPKTGKMPYSGSMPGAEEQNEQLEKQLPEDGGMIQNYPNPFNPTTTISYRLPNAGKVELKVYDILGREVMTLVNGYQEAGMHTAHFNGQGLASGVYFYRLTAPGINQVKKMLMTK